MHAGVCVRSVPHKPRPVGGLSKLRVSVPQDLKERQARDGMKVVLDKVKKAYPERPPLMDPVGEMGITAPNFKKVRFVPVLSSYEPP